MLRGWLERPLLSVTDIDRRSGAVAALVNDTIRREEGCIRYDYYFSAQQEDKILLVEQWQTQAHQRIHLQQPHMARLRELKEQYVADTRLGRVTLEEA